MEIPTFDELFDLYISQGYEPDVAEEKALAYLWG